MHVSDIQLGVVWFIALEIQLLTFETISVCVCHQDNLDEAMLHQVFPYLWTSDVSNDVPHRDRPSPRVSALLQVGSFYLMASRWQQQSGSITDALQEDCAGDLLDTMFS